MYGLQIAFKDFKPGLGFFGSKWVGFDNFINFFQSAQFGTLIRNTISLNLLSLLAFPLPIILALMLNYCVSKRYTKVVQMATYAPHFISIVVLVGMIKIFCSPSVGVINKVITLFGGSAINFMAIPGWFKYLYVGSGIWSSIGWDAVIFIGALTSISTELHEAARVDGATKLKRIIHVDLPGIAPTVVVMFIMRIGHMMNLGFQKVFLMQNDINLPVSEVISTYVYKVGLLKSYFSYSTAIDLFNTMINITLLIVFNRISKKVTKMGLY